MSFTTLTFLAFFAVVFWGYYLIPKKGQWMWLCAASVIFYAFASLWSLCYLFGTALVSYGAARYLSAQDERCRAASEGLGKAERSALKKKFGKKKRAVTAIAVIALIGTLVAVKYTGLFADTLGALTKRELSLPFDILLPVGLSFYLFQSVAYLVDVSRGNYPAERNFFRYLLYISYFPHVLQGPLDDYASVSSQLYASREFDGERAVRGAQRAAWGFFKKLVIANQISVIVSPVFAEGGQDGLSTILCVFLYSIQLYADFSGYMDIAIGCSEMLGVRIAENFRAPYFSGSIAEFWRRWHITLGAWFKNYLFYPLLRSRGLTKLRKALKKNKYLSSALPTAIALSVVWLLIGFWHGANWSYVFYGIYHGFFIVAETIFAPLYAKSHEKFPKLQKNAAFRAFRVVRTFVLVTVGYYLFAPASLGVTVTLLRDSLHFDGGAFVAFLTTNLRELIVAIAGTAALTFVDLRSLREDRLPVGEVISRKQGWVRALLYGLFLFVILFFGLYGSGFDQFAYFKF